MVAVGDTQVAHVVQSELRYKLTFGDLARLWAKAHAVPTDLNAETDIDTLCNFFGV